MISDALYDAVAAIKDHQKTSPECYGDLGEQINSTVSNMDMLRQYLDILRPEPENEGWSQTIDVILALLENPYTPEREREHYRQMLRKMAEEADQKHGDGGTDVGQPQTAVACGNLVFRISLAQVNKHLEEPISVEQWDQFKRFCLTEWNFVGEVVNMWCCYYDPATGDWIN